MNCADYQKEIMLLHMEELPEERRGALERHLQICAACTHFQRDVRAAKAAVRDGELPDRDVDVWSRVRERITRRRPLVPRWVLVPAFSLLMLVSLMTRTLVRVQSPLSAADTEIVTELDFFTDYDLWQDFDVIERLDPAA